MKVKNNWLKDRLIDSLIYQWKNIKKENNLDILVNSIQECYIIILYLNVLGIHQSTLNVVKDRITYEYLKKKGLNEKQNKTK